MNSGTRLWEEKAKNLFREVPLISERAELFLPKQWPAYYQSAKGVRITDLDGNEYTDISIMGVGSASSDTVISV